MQKYEIRILRLDGRTALIIAESHWSDTAAICSAKKLAQGRKCEVWREMDCIYGLEDSPPSEHPPDRPAA